MDAERRVEGRLPRQRQRRLRGRSCLQLRGDGSRNQARKHLGDFLDTNPEFEAQTEVRGILEMLGIGGEDEPLDVDEE